MSNKRKEVPEAGNNEGPERSQDQKAKRTKGKERVTFAERNQTRVFNADEELQEGEEQLIEGDRITKVLGEEELQQWSDDEAEIEPFNLKAENQEGYFDRNGNYVENKPERDAEDGWVEEYDEKWAKKFSATQAARAKAAQEDDKPVTHDRVTLLKIILEMLQPKESVSAALKRFSGSTSAPGKKGAKNAKGEANKGKEGRDMDKFNKLTETADALLSSGYSDIYSDKREDVEDTLAEDLANQASSASSADQVMWEYKGAEGAMFGPYTSANMRSWKAQGYFTGEGAVPIRKVKKEGEDDDMFADAPIGDTDGFVSSDSIDFNLYP